MAKLKIYKTFVKKLQKRRGKIIPLRDKIQEQYNKYLKKTESDRKKLDQLQLTIATLEEALREIAEKDWNKRGIRQPFPGIQVRELRQMHIYDEDKALNWCRSHDMFLQMDKVALREFVSRPKFEDKVKGVSVQVVPSVALAKQFKEEDYA